MTEPVEVARERFEGELQGLRDTLDEEFGWRPTGMKWLIPVAAVVVGFVAGGVVKRRAFQLFGLGRRRVR